MNSQQKNPWIDGYLAHMFGSQDIVGYHASLLKREARDLIWHAQVSGSLLFFSAASPNPHDPNHWIIDYGRTERGLVIPQQIWVPSNRTEVQRYVVHEPLRPPIFLVHSDSSDLGFPLVDIAEGNCMNLRDADETAPVGLLRSSSHAQIRINVS